MALFRPVATPADLPDVGAGRESGTYDFKGSVDPKKKRELAKDVAAFANALGGVILVGAVEDRETGKIREYAPMDEARAELVKAAYDSAVPEFCRPQPVVDTVTVESPSTGFVVAVNVHPTPLGPVGVRGGEDPKVPYWAFPLRTTTHTTYLTPTELAMLMVPAVRRVAILLGEIPSEQRTGVRLFHKRLEAGPYFDVNVVDLDLTTITIAWRSRPTIPVANTAIPLDRVTSVWRRGSNSWAMAIDGEMMRSPNEAEGLQFYP